MIAQYQSEVSPLVVAKPTVTTNKIKIEKHEITNNKLSINRLREIMNVSTMTWAIGLASHIQHLNSTQGFNDT